MLWNIGITRDNRNKLVLLTLVMLSAMLLPSFEIRESLPRVRFDEALIFGVYGLNILIFALGGFRYDIYAKEEIEERQRTMRSIRQVFLILVISIIVSNIFAVIVHKTPYGIRDVMEFITIFKYYLVVTLVGSLDIRRWEFGLIRNTLLVGFFLILALSWGQYFNLGNINEWLTPFFAPAHLNNLVMANPPRVLGTFDNPNVIGIFSVITLAIFTTRFYFFKDRTLTNIMLIVLLALNIKLIYLTISRTALLGTAAVLTFLSIWAFFRNSWSKEVLLKVGILFVITVTLFVTSPMEFTSRMAEATNLDKSTSAQGHLLRFEDAINQIKGSLILGWGTAKSTMTTLVDNEYLLIARRYGLVGLLAYLWFFFKPVSIAWRRISDGSRYRDVRVLDNKTFISISFIGAIVAVLIYNLTAGIFYNLQLMTLFAVFMGMIYNMERERF